MELILRVREAMGVCAGASPLPGSDNLLLDEGRALLVPALRCPEGRRGSCSWRRQRPTDAMAEASHRGSARCSLPSHLANTAAASALASSIAPLQPCCATQISEQGFVLFTTPVSSPRTEVSRRITSCQAKRKLPNSLVSRGHEASSLPHWASGTPPASVPSTRALVFPH